VRQLDIFKSKRQRGRAPAPPKEFLLHVALADALRLWINPGWSFTHLPFGEYRNPITAGRLKRMGVTRGWPDFMIVGWGSQRCGFVFIELKRKGEKPTVEQADRGEQLVRAGALWLWTDSVDDAIGFLADLGAVRMRVSA
jgi:hypothetical protein